MRQPVLCTRRSERHTQRDDTGRKNLESYKARNYATDRNKESSRRRSCSLPHRACTSTSTIFLTKSSITYSSWPRGSCNRHISHAPWKVTSTFAISYVCSRWRRVALWNNTLLDLHRSTHVHVTSLHQQWLLRAGRRPLMLSIIFGTAMPIDDIVRLVQKVLSSFQIKKLSLDLNDDQLMALSTLPETVLSSFTELDVVLLLISPLQMNETNGGPPNTSPTNDCVRQLRVTDNCPRDLICAITSRAPTKSLTSTRASLRKNSVKRNYTPHRHPPTDTGYIKYK